MLKQINVNSISLPKAPLGGHSKKSLVCSIHGSSLERGLNGWALVVQQEHQSG